MESTSTGALVIVAGDGPKLDGIVFDVPSRTKVVVAVVVPGRGPSFRTVHPETLSEREAEGPSDRALRQLMRRTPSPSKAGVTGGGAAARGRAGHGRAAMHRTTGK